MDSWRQQIGQHTQGVLVQMQQENGVLREVRQIEKSKKRVAWQGFRRQRWTTTRLKSGGKNRFNMIRQRAMQQHVDYVRQLDPPRPYRSNEVEPQLWSIREESRTVFGDPEITKQPTETMLRSLAQPTSTNYKGRKTGADCVELMSVRDLCFQEMTEKLTASELGREAEGKSGVAGRVMVLPMAPNLLPYRGLGLEAYDRGGPAVVKATYEAALQCSHLSREDIEQGANINLEAGDALEPRNSSLALVEEAFEMLLQVEAEQPSYALQRIAFVDSDLETAEAFASAVVEVSRRWLPAERLTTAPEWWGKKTRRLLVLPDVPNFFWRRFKVKFKKRHGVKKRQRVHYLGNNTDSLQCAASWRLVSRALYGGHFISGTMFRKHYSDLLDMLKMLRSSIPLRAEFVQAYFAAYLISYVRPQRSWSTELVPLSIPASVQASYSEVLDECRGRGAQNFVKVLARMRCLLSTSLQQDALPLSQAVWTTVQKLRAEGRRPLVFASTEREAEALVRHIACARRFRRRTSMAPIEGSESQEELLIFTVGADSAGLNLQSLGDALVLRPVQMDQLEVAHLQKHAAFWSLHVKPVARLIVMATDSEDVGGKYNELLEKTTTSVPAAPDEQRHRHAIANSKEDVWPKTYHFRKRSGEFPRF
eukprot:g10038.t1